MCSAPISQTAKTMDIQGLKPSCGRHDMMAKAMERLPAMVPIKGSRMRSAVSHNSMIHNCITVKNTTWVFTDCLSAFYDTAYVLETVYYKTGSFCVFIRHQAMSFPDDHSRTDTRWPGPHLEAERPWPCCPRPFQWLP